LKKKIGTYLYNEWMTEKNLVRHQTRHKAVPIKYID
jgi:hypothetical protein